MVALGLVAGEIPLVPAQALGHALRRDGAALVLHEAPVPVALETQLERGVGVEHEVLVVGGVVGDLRALGGQQVERLVVRVMGDLGRETGGELGDPALVVGLRVESAQGAAEVDALALLRRPAVERRTDGRTVAAGEGGQPLVCQHVTVRFSLHEEAAAQGAQDLVGTPTGDPAHQPRQVVRRAERPRHEQVERLLVGPRELQRECGVELL